MDEDIHENRTSFENPRGVLENDAMELISILKFFSKIKQGEKITIGTTLPWVSDDGMLSRLNRTARTIFIKKESRGDTLDYLERVTSRAFGLIKVVGDATRDMLISALDSSRAGIANLIETYKEDRMFISRLETFNEALERKLTALENPT